MRALRTGVKTSKYRAVKTNGYASKKEAKRAAELKLLEKAGKITFLGEQVKYEIVPAQKGERAAHYVADFQYLLPSRGLVIEDVKGVRTREYILKRKLMLYVHGIRITEV